MDWAFWRRWTLIVAAGEMAGFTMPATAGALLATSHVPPWPGYAVMLVTGAAEGACLGYAQAWVLRTRLPRLDRTTFTFATVAAAVVAYALGMLPSAIGDLLTRAPTALVVVLGAIGAMLLLCSIGTAQWLVLRRIEVHAPWWIGVTAVAWVAGLAIFLAVATPLWREGQPLWLTVVIGILAGALMAATVAALTGLGAVRLKATAPPRP